MFDIEFTDRYDALGITKPDPETMCEAHCEGTGWVPIYMAKGNKRKDVAACGEDEKDPVFIKLWEQAEKENPQDDGWHFVKCPDCGGTGKE